MLKKIMCLCITILLASSVFFTAHAVESKTLRDVCENEKTFEAIEAMTESDKLELYVRLSYPEAEKLSYSLQSATGEEFLAKRDQLYAMYKSFCEEFINDHSLKAATLCSFSAMVICKLSPDDITSIVSDERFESFSITESGIESDGSKTLKDVCEDEKTLKAIESMSDSDKVELYIRLSCPEADKLSYTLQSTAGEEFSSKRKELYEMYKSFCEKFVKDHSLSTTTHCPFTSTIICSLTLEDIGRIMDDERFVEFSLTESGIEVDGSKSLKDVCRGEETLKAIKSMTNSDELELYVILSYPEAEKLRYSLPNVSEEELQLKINELYEMYKSFCEKFVNDHSLKSATLCPFAAMIICKLTLDDIETIINDERFEGFSLTETGIENDYKNDDTENLPDDHLFEESTDLEIILGDIDGDNSVTMLDVTILQKVIAGICQDYSQVTILDCADINKDNYCNMLDVVLIQRMIAKL